ncbi:UNVERIFIED_CONTAM: hypothetical protein HDU68_003816 [Siphonaria sp. JEL0065]|nr:hypothetical protein HDU68_003816 [Siphonaria sp. JEL0065]
MGELNDLDINNMEEIEDLTTQQRLEEFELISKQAVIEADMVTALEHQKYKLEAAQLLDKQKSFQARLQRVQKKQTATIAKGQRAASRTRERILIADNPIIKGDSSAYETDKAYGSDGYSESQSEGTSRSGGSVMSLHEQKEAIAAAEQEATSETDLTQKEEAEKNRNERRRAIAIHHKKVLTELKQQHRSNITQKTKEQRRKVSELLKDHEEEVEQLKMDQAATMKGRGLVTEPS